MVERKVLNTPQTISFKYVAKYFREHIFLLSHTLPNVLYTPKFSIRFIEDHLTGISGTRSYLGYFKIFLILFQPNVPFLSPLKMSSFLTFLGSIEIEHWVKMG